MSTSGAPPEDRRDPRRADNAREPVELIRQSGAVLRMGKAMLASGTGSYRVKSAMQQVARAFGLDRHEAHVTLTEITTTSHRGSVFRTEVAEVRSIGVNAHRLGELTTLANGLQPGVSVEELNAELDRIERIPALHSPLANALFAAVACGAFAFLNDGGVVEVLGAFVAAGAGQAVRRYFLHRRFNQFAVTMLAAAVACLTYLGFVSLLDLATVGGGSSHEAGFISAVLFLVPGFALVTGALDLAKLDFSAGVARTTYALIILLSAALSVWTVSWVTGMSADPIAAPSIPLLAHIGLRLVASAAGVLGFALMFNSTIRMALGAAAIGMVANVLRLHLADAGVAMQAATILATLVVGLLAAWVAPRLNVPRITVSVPAVVIMVPGAAVYRTVVGLNNGDVEVAVTSGVQAVFVVICIAIGLAAARVLTDRAWAYEK
jgi:uncharacterized membrane protein YjjP (DUF1212 family)